MAPPAVNRQRRRADKKPRTVTGQEALLVRPADAVEQTMPDGTVLKVLLFEIVTADGGILVETNAAGQKVPVQLASVPIPVRRSILVPGGIR